MKPPWINTHVTPSNHVIFFRCPITETEEGHNSVTPTEPDENEDGCIELEPGHLHTSTEFVDEMNKAEEVYISVTPTESDENVGGSNELELEHLHTSAEFVDEMIEAEEGQNSVTPTELDEKEDGSYKLEPEHLHTSTEFVDEMNEAEEVYISVTPTEPDENVSGINELESGLLHIPAEFVDEMNQTDEGQNSVTPTEPDENISGINELESEPFPIQAEFVDEMIETDEGQNSVTPTESDENVGGTNDLKLGILHIPVEFVDEMKVSQRHIEDHSIDQQDMVTPDPCQITPALTDITDADPPITCAGTYNRIDNYAQGKGCFMTKKIPFSVHVEIDDFLHNPICGEIAQNTFEFHDQHNQKFPVPEIDTKLLHTTTYYPEQPDCRLVFSEINEIIFVKDEQKSSNTDKNHYKAVGRPLHDTSHIKKRESNEKTYKHIRVPVVLGEYKIEIGLEDIIEFPEDVLRVKKITKEIITTNFRLMPTDFSPSNNGTRTALKGILFIEGYILQKIEYTAFQNCYNASIAPITLGQKIVVELIIHILQTQKVKIPFL